MRSARRSLPAILLATLLLPGGIVLAGGLAESVRDGERAAALRLIEGGAEVDVPASDGSTALLWAVHQVDHELVQALLARGADPDVRNVLGASPLAEAVQLGDARLVRMLLDAGADPDLGNADGQTPLMTAAGLGLLPIVQALVEAGAEVNARERFRGQTALMWAAGAGHDEVSGYLIARGAEVDVRAAVNDWGNQITSEPRAQYRPAGGHTPCCLRYAQVARPARSSWSRQGPTSTGLRRRASRRC